MLRKELNLHPFYQKYTNVGGLPVLSSGNASDAGLEEAARIVNKMLERRDDIRDALIRNHVRVVVMAPAEKTTDVPEHASLQPKEFWDDRARGVGATPPRPVSSCGEENLLNLPGDRYARENILIHEFAHTIHVMALNSIDPSFDTRLRLAYQHAMTKGLWTNTYAATSHTEYWAETVQSYFDSNDANNKNHNDISTHDKLSGYDGEVFALIDEVFRKSSWRYQRYDVRQGKKPPAEIRQVRLTIANKGHDEASIFWMSGTAPKLYRKLAPGQSYDQVATSGQKWQAVQTSSGVTTNFVVPDGDGLWTLE